MSSRVSRLAIHHLAASSPSRSLLPRARRPSLISTMPTRQDKNALRTIQTAACLVIGDEVLGGKTVDTNSAYVAKWCFSLGISLKRVEVIEDDESDIIEAVRRMSDRYDFVVTSGGIGPTHDDITYQSVAKAFDLPLKLHQEGLEKMKRLSRPHTLTPDFDWETDSPALRAKLRMVRLPTDETRNYSDQFLFVSDSLWVPVSVVNGNVHILPGVPSLFRQLLDGLKPHVLPRLVDPGGKGTTRVLISTPLPESAVAAYLTDLAARVACKGVKVGSYPRWGKKTNTVSLVGRDQQFLEGLVAEVEENVQGRRVGREGEGEDD